LERLGVCRAPRAGGGARGGRQAGAGRAVGRKHGPAAPARAAGGRAGVGDGETVGACSARRALASRARRPHHSPPEHPAHAQLTCSSAPSRVSGSRRPPMASQRSRREPFARPPSPVARLLRKVPSAGTLGTAPSTGARYALQEELGRGASGQVRGEGWAVGMREWGGCAHCCFACRGTMHLIIHVHEVVSGEQRSASRDTGRTVSQREPRTPPPSSPRSSAPSTRSPAPSSPSSGCRWRLRGRRRRCRAR